MKLGWLNAQGMKDICTFVSKLRATAVHLPGPQRCEAMRKYYRQLIERAGQQARAPAPATEAADLGARPVAPGQTKKIRKPRIVKRQLARAADIDPTTLSRMETAGAKQVGGAHSQSASRARCSPRE